MVYGHEDKKNLFERLALSDSLSHAYLFFGDSGIGKFLFARHLAYFLEKKTWDMKEHSLPLIDSRMFYPPEDKTTIGIDEAREIKSFLWSTPIASLKRVAIVNDSHLLTPEAQSAMLKIVEEPPKHALIIFVSHNPSVFSAPLLSRLVRIYFKRFSYSQMVDFLKHQGVSEAEIRSMVKKSYGRPGQILSMLENQMKEKSEEDVLEEYAVKLREEGVLKNSKKLSVLLQTFTDMKRYRLNKELQKKSTQYLLYAHH